MKFNERELVAFVTVIFFVLYFLPFTVFKFFSVAVILFFSPGYFLVRMYRDASREERYLLAPVVSLGISGLVAVALSALSLLSRESMLLIMCAVTAVSYLLSVIFSPVSSTGSAEKQAQRFAAVLMVLMLLTTGAWAYLEFSTHPEPEVDMAIQQWPVNASMNSTLTFAIYVKNWNHPGKSFRVVYSLNNHTVEERTFTLAPGDSKVLYFHSKPPHPGKNLASFDLYIDGNYYTNVHVYFRISR